VRAGYSAGFLVLAAVAAIGLLVFWLAMPESKPPESPVTAEPRGDLPGDALVSAR
jgi:predicted MFS family arabinose efflux permease